MAFRPVNDLLPNPDVRIFFVGQLILEPLREAQACEVYVNQRASNHFLSVEVRLKRPNRPDEIQMRHVGDLTLVPSPPGTSSGSDFPRHGMFILASSEVDPTNTNNAISPVVKAYNGSNPSPEGEELDLALNMSRIHDVICGPVEPAGGRPSILINGGTFYTAEPYPAGAILRKRRPGSLPKPQPKFAGIIGVNINLPPREVVNVIWRNNGQVERLMLPKIANATHEIYISNEPLYQDDSPDAQTTHDEFAEFYQILPGIPQHEQFVLTTPPVNPTLGSLRTPCMSVLLDQ